MAPRRRHVPRIERCLIDANWGSSTDVVYQFCRQSAHSSIVMPSHGRFVGASSLPFSEYKRKPGERVGLNWRITNVHGKRAVRHVVFDTNYWKSFAHAKPQAVTAPGKPPRVSRIMALAIHLDQLVRVGHVASYADLARLGHVNRSRVTQIMTLLQLAPDIQEAILFLPPRERGREAIKEREPRAIARVPAWKKQRRLWKERRLKD